MAGISINPSIPSTVTPRHQQSCASLCMNALNKISRAAFCVFAFMALTASPVAGSSSLLTNKVVTVESQCPLSYAPPLIAYAPPPRFPSTLGCTTYFSSAEQEQHKLSEIRKAIYDGDYSKSTSLISADTCWGVGYSYWEYAMRISAKLGNTQVMQFLLMDSRFQAFRELRPNVINSATSNPFTESLNLASEYGNTAIVQMLLGRSELESEENNMLRSPTLLVTPLCRAAREGHADILRLLLEDQRTLPEDVNEALTAAASANQLTSMQILLTDSRITGEGIERAQQIAHLPMIATAPSDNLLEDAWPLTWQMLPVDPEIVYTLETAMERFDNVTEEPIIVHPPTFRVVL